MKKLLLCFLFCLPLPVFASVIVVDADTNRMLYGVQENEVKLIASTTKIMTALVVINNADLHKMITIDENVLRSFGSGIYIEVGERINIMDLLYGLLMRSGNDAAIALATEVGGSEEGFVILMNNLAQSIGMYNTHFINASGLENDEGDGNTSTAKDMAKLMAYAMQNPTFRQITATEHYIVKTNYKTYEWYNKNKLLNMYKYTTGGKTGYTKKAYRTLVTSASKDGKNLIVVTLDEANDFELHKSLYEKYFKQYQLVSVINKKTFLKEDNMYVKNDFKMLLNEEEITKVNVEVTYTNDALERAGYVAVNLNGNEYYRDNIYHINNNDKISFWTRIKNFFANLFGQI